MLLRLWVISLAFVLLAQAQIDSRFSLTIYTNNLAVFKKAFSQTFQTGINVFQLPGVPPSIIPETFTLSTLSKEISVLGYQFHPGTQENTPALVLDLMAHKAQDSIIYTGFLFRNLTWKMLYSAELSAKQNSLDLNGWIAVDNQTGMEFDNAYLHFIESHANYDSVKDINLTPSPHAYHLERPITLQPGIKHLSWVKATSLPIQKDYRVYVGGAFLQDLQEKTYRPPIETWVSFSNSQTLELGQSLPSGKMTLLQRNYDGASQILGTTDLQRTAPDQTINIRLPATVALQDDKSNFFVPQAITCDLEQTDFKHLSENVMEMGYRLSFSNKILQPQTLKVILDVPSGEWSLLREHPKHDSSSKNEIVWIITIPARTENGDGQFEMKYRIRFQHT